MKKKIFEKYVSRVIEIMGITREQLFTKTKYSHIVEARQILYYLCSAKMRVCDIEKLMCENGYEITHSTIIHGIKVAKKESRRNRAFSNTVTEIR